ncbi:RecB family exonuclease [Nakamurella sp.]|uniref:RecB family exonuclease n=1 Tax=Nakamurella sp. TaxID=1869182 RepID=UPI003B3A2593
MPATAASATAVPATVGTDAPPRRRLALSPSRASDFKSCPLLYRLRAIDRLPEPPSPAAVRGTLVHAVLEAMFGQPPADRTPDRAVALVGPTWERMAQDCPDLAGLLPPDDVAAWLSSARSLVRSYFDLEDPRRFEPEACEYAVEIDTADGVPLRGFIDRLDLAPTGELRIVDYKTGRSPGPDFEGAALYQLKFYALMIYRLRGVVPAQLKLIYLADGLSLQYAPTEAELLSFAQSVGALWRAMVAAVQSGNFPARRGQMCRWCSHQALCPEFGGTPPPYPGPPEPAPTAGDPMAPNPMVPNPMATDPAVRV